MTVNGIAVALEKVGIAKKSVVCLGSIAHQPEHMPYLDLLPTSRDGDISLPDAVIEESGQPLMYIVRRDSLDPKTLTDIMTVVASRGDARLLGALRPGVLDIYPIWFSDTASVGRGKLPWETLKESLKLDGSRPVLREYLDAQNWGASTPGATHMWLETLLFDLLSEAAKNIKNATKLPDGDVLSLVGRALFVRFLVDRGIVTPNLVPQISRKATSDVELLKEEHIAETFSWLDNTFNGDLLTLGDRDGYGLTKSRVDSYRAYFNGINPRVREIICDNLTNVLHRSKGGQMRLDWESIKFNHVPADLLSQVYEHFYRSFPDPNKKAKSESVNYTPRSLATLVLNGCFDAMRTDKERHEAKILDPSAGGGVFLSLALRRLAQERWKSSQKQPDRKAIRSILENQIFGFDINRDALKVAALGLYLTALELDPDPHPPGALKFKRLFDRNLHEFSEKAIGDDMGSLSEKVREKFSGQFDIVAGNPPWTNWDKKKGKKLTPLVQGILERRGDFAREKIDRYKSRFFQPDTPFVWRATEWAKPGGGIGFLLNSRLLFQADNDGKPVERHYLFRAIRLTRVIDGSSIRQEKRIWPGTDAPFILMVARNERPEGRAMFHFISLHKEKKRNKAGLFRIDARSAHPIPVNRILDTPHLFKTLMRGAALDVELVSRLQGMDQNPLGEYFKKHDIGFHRGFETLTGDGKESDATDMIGLPVLTPAEVKKHGFHYRIDAGRLDKSRYEKLRVCGKLNHYLGPLVLFRQKGASKRREQGALYCDGDLFYKNAFYGISLRNVPNSLNLARYLSLLSYSRLFLYYPLMTSNKFGVERETILLEDYKSFPFIPYEKLLKNQKDAVATLANRIEKGEGPWEEIDDLVADIYDLSMGERGLVNDAYEYALPFADSVNKAEAPPEPAMVDSFCRRLEEIIAPLAKRAGKITMVKPILFENTNKSWRFVHIHVGEGAPDLVNASTLNRIGWLTEPLDISQVRLHLGHGDLILGQLAQRRYWTASRAWLFALEWVDNQFNQPKNQS